MSVVRSRCTERVSTSLQACSSASCYHWGHTTKVRTQFRWTSSVLLVVKRFRQRLELRVMAHVCRRVINGPLQNSLASKRLVSQNHKISATARALKDASHSNDFEQSVVHKPAATMSSSRNGPERSFIISPLSLRRYWK